MLKQFSAHILYNWFLLKLFPIFSDNVDDVCKANPGMIKPNPVNCGQYYNCSTMTKYGHHLMECTYPDLFDPVTSQCRKFYSVKCEKKHEPMAPCK